ncbi:MAG: hypothetical protein ACK5PB_03615, partial [Pirellula sp.]
MNYLANIASNLPAIFACIAATLLSFFYPNGLLAQTSKPRLRSDPPRIESSWDDLLEGVKTAEDWAKHRVLLKQRYLELIRDQHKPARVPLDLKVHEEMEIDGIYRRFYISYQVEAEERAHAYLGIPIALNGRAPAVVALH